ncbi:MAG: ATP-binding cassette domain-containing protein [Spirochaetota bacterium]
MSSHTKTRRDQRPHQADAGEPPVLQCQDLCFSYGATNVLDGVCLTVQRGESVLLLGQNGEGKTTLMACILGMLHLRSGTIARAPGLRMAGYISTPPFMEDQDGWMHMRYEQALRRRSAGAQDDGCEDLLPRVQGICEVLSLDPAELDKKLRHCSTGNRKKMALARALLSSPDLLILDEPANGLDPSGISELRSVLCRLRAEFGCSIVISSHQIAESARQATRAVILSKGRIVRSIGLAHDRETMWSCSLAEPAGPVAVSYVHALGGEFADEDFQRIRFALTNDGGEPRAAARIVKMLVAKGLKPTAFGPARTDLEQAYLSAVGDR